MDSRRILLDRAPFVASVRRTAFRVAAVFVLTGTPAPAAEFAHETDMALRYVDISEESTRTQYRFRFRPDLVLDGPWSLHAFVSTGSDYDTAYNTIDDNDDKVYVRRAFVRYETEAGKVEAGIIPPFKGRISSTGLSGEGWVKGIRGVWRANRGRFELVLGQLDDLNARSALRLPDEIDYYEFEYSGQISRTWSFEASLERMLGDNFIRGELRHVSPADVAYAMELVLNTDETARKFVVSMDRTLRLGSSELDWFSFYAYANEDFGLRAELTEDFLEFGHAVSSELSGDLFGSGRADWFAAIEFYESQTRFEMGLEYAFR